MTGFFHSGPEPYSHYLQNEQKYVSLMSFYIFVNSYLLVATGATLSCCKMECAVQTVLTAWTVQMQRNSYLVNVHWDISSMPLAL